MAPLPLLASLAIAFGTTADRLGPGDTTRTIHVGDVERTYHVHIPRSFDPTTAGPVPVVLAFHPFATSGKLMILISGLSETADREGFVVVFPEGSGPIGLRNWNEGGIRRKTADDVAFARALLDDLATVVPVDPRRVYATGMSNGAMLCYRLASEMSDRIAAIATVAGTMAIPSVRATRPVPVAHFHGTEDTLVPFGRPGSPANPVMGFRSVEDTIRAWIEADGCPVETEEEILPDAADDGTTVRRRRYGPGKDGSEVVLYTIERGGHTWPGREVLGAGLLGRSTRDIDANALIWAFFRAHPMP